MTDFICEMCKDTCRCPHCRGNKCGSCHQTGFCPYCCQTELAHKQQRQDERYQTEHQPAHSGKGRRR